MVTDVMKWHWGPPALKCHIRDYQNKDRLSVCRILSLQRIPKLGRGLDIAGLDFGSQSCQYCWFLAKSVLFHSVFPHNCYSWISCCASIIRWEPGFLVAFSDIFQNFLEEWSCKELASASALCFSFSLRVDRVSVHVWNPCTFLSYCRTKSRFGACYRPSSSSENFWLNNVSFSHTPPRGVMFGWCTI